MNWKLRAFLVIVSVIGVGWLTGCASPAKNVSKLRLGDTPEIVLDKMGKPNTVRAGKVYEDETTVEVWEYLPGLLTVYPKSYWLFIENGRLVMWGEPGDFAAGTPTMVGEYSSKKRVQ